VRNEAPKVAEVVRSFLRKGRYRVCKAMIMMTDGTVQ
jgi:hypothetical protein